MREQKYTLGERGMGEGKDRTRISLLNLLPLPEHFLQSADVQLDTGSLLPLPLSFFTDSNYSNNGLEYGGSLVYPAPAAKSSLAVPCSQRFGYSHNPLYLWEEKLFLFFFFC